MVAILMVRIIIPTRGINCVATATSSFFANCVAMNEEHQRRFPLPIAGSSS
eukprot:COSAG03_NODE_10370_length_655_cov_0.553957_2_plen_50_part_01